MSHPRLLPTLDKFHGMGCRTLMRRWWIGNADLARAAGVHHRRMVAWLGGHLPSHRFEGRLAVYDAMFGLVAAKAAWAARETARLKEAHDAKRRSL